MSGNLELKRFLLTEYPEATKLQRRLSYLCFLLPYIQDGKSDLSLDEALELESEREYLLMKWSLLYLEAESLGFQRSVLADEVNRLNNAFYARLKRLRKRVSDMIVNYDSLWFVTLTFNDDTLFSTGRNYRKRLVKEFLQDYPSYVANIDFGAKNGREHYHCLIAGDSVIDSNWFSRGFIYPELCYTDLDSDCVRVAKYVAKLSNHAVKETAQLNKLIYSRSKRKC